MQGKLRSFADEYRKETGIEPGRFVVAPRVYDELLDEMFGVERVGDKNENLRMTIMGIPIYREVGIPEDIVYVLQDIPI